MEENSSPDTNDLITTVTGANRGIGLGIAECCLSNGCEKVISIDITDPSEEDFGAIQKRFPGQLLAVKADVTKEESIQGAVDDILEKHGKLNGMIVNAGKTNHKSALDFTTEEIESLFAINVCTITASSPFFFSFWLFGAELDDI